MTNFNEYAPINFNGQIYTQTGATYADNYGSDSEVRYYAHAIGTHGNKVKVEWVTTEAWDNSEKIFKLEQKPLYDV